MPKNFVDNINRGRQALKSLEELSKTYSELDINKVLAAQTHAISGFDPEALKKYVNELKSVIKSEKDLLKVLEAIRKSTLDRLEYSKQDAETQKQLRETHKSIFDAIKQIDTVETSVNKTIDARKSLYNDITKALNVIKRENEEIFKISHEMQLQSNLTWREYTRAYDEAYKAARRMNQETATQLHNARDIVEMQNALLRDGWRGLDMGTLTDVAASMKMVSTTLGIDFPAELSTALQASYKQFGDDTNLFITQLGNRLNAFSDSFGTSIGMLTGVVTQMSASTSFLARNNMEAQIRANESLMKAAALSGAVGLTSTDFISSLALTSQYGTADEMSSIYEGGALLQGFNTAQFQQQMIGGGADEAISMLFESIAGTLSGVEDNHYLRNEYMRTIGSSFGLSQSDLLNIMTYGGDLSQYDEDIQEQLMNVNTSMVDEIKELKVDLLDQLKNWWTTSSVSQGFGKVMQEFGLYGVSGELNQIKNLVRLIAYTPMGKGVMGKLGGTAATSAQGANGLNIMPIGGEMSNLSKGLRVGGGLAAYTASQAIGGSIQQNTNIGNAGANIGGGAMSILGGAGAGALVGSAIPVWGTAVGAVIGGTLGLINTLQGASERKSALEDIEDQRRANLRQTVAAPTGDATVDAINQQTRILENAINNSANTVAQTSLTVDLYNKTTTV